MKKLLLEIKELFIITKNKGFFHLLFSNIFVNFFAFGSQLLVAWILTPVELGQIKILQAFVSVAVIFASFGFDSSTLKLCSENIDITKKKELFKSANIFTTYTTLFTYIILYILSFFNIISSDNFINKYFNLFLIALIPQTFNMLHFSYLQALKKIELIAKISVYSKTISFIFIIIITYFFNVFGFIIAFLLGYLFTSIFLYKNIKADLAKISVRLYSYFPVHWKYSKFAFLSNLTSGLTRYLDLFIINYFIADRISIGMYSFALNVILVLQIIGDTIQKISIPHFSENSSNINNWKIIFNKYYKIFIIITLIILIILNIFIEPFIKFIFNNKYDNSLIFIRILSLRWFFYALVQFQGSALFGLGKINYNFYGSLVFLIINFIIQYILVINYGIFGVVYGVTIGNFIYYFIYSIIFKYAYRSS